MGGHGIGVPRHTCNIKFNGNSVVSEEVGYWRDKINVNRRVTMEVRWKISVRHGTMRCSSTAP